MDFIDKIRELSGRFEKNINIVETEEATKTAFVMPFIHEALGYNSFDPTQVVPEFTADVGTKKGEKVDYAVLKDGKPIMLFEVKRCGADLDSEAFSQLYRYFSVTDTARFGVLTDGVKYRFYSDLESDNKLDVRPFLEFDMLNFDEEDVNELKKFSKSAFDLDDILTTAVELKNVRGIKRILAEQWASPEEDFVRLFASKVHSGNVTRRVIEQFQGHTKTAFHQFVRERIRELMESASALAEEQVAPAETVAGTVSAAEPIEPTVGSDGKAIITTQEEFQGYYIVKAIFHGLIDPKRIWMRDRVSYCGILLDNTNRKPICRLYFNGTKKSIGLFDAEKKEQRAPIEEIDDLFQYADRLTATVGYYENPQPPAQTP